MNPYPPEHYYARCTDASARLWKEEYMAEFTVVNSDPVSREVAEIERLHADIAKTHPHINEVRSSATRLSPRICVITVIAHRRRGETGKPVSVLMESLTEEGGRLKTPKVLHVIPVEPPTPDQPVASGYLFAPDLHRRMVQVPIDKKTDPRLTAFNCSKTLGEVFVDDPVVPRPLMQKFLADCSLHRTEIAARFEAAVPALLRIEKARTNPAKLPEKHKGTPTTDRVDVAEALVLIKRAFYKAARDPFNEPNFNRAYPDLVIPDSYTPNPSP